MKVIFEQEPYKVTLQHKAGLKAIDLLKHTLWGTKETVYQHQHTEQNIEKVIHGMIILKISKFHQRKFINL